MPASNSLPSTSADELFQAELAKRNLSFSINPEGLYEVKLGDVTAKLNLENLRRDYARDNDPLAIARFAKQLDLNPFDESPSWEDVKPFLRYCLEPADYAGGFGDTLHDVITDELVKVYAFTPPDGSQIAWINMSMLKEWGANERQVIELAEANMSRILSETKFSIEKIDGARLGMLATEEAPFKASLILTKAFREFVEPELGWPVYVVVPTRDFVFIISKQDYAFLGRVGPVVLREFKESGYPITADVLEVGDNGLTAIGSFAPQK